MLQTGARQLRSKIFGVMLRSARVRKGIAAETAADVLKLPPSTILDFELGQQAISLPQLEILASLYGVPCRNFWSPQSSVDKSNHKTEETLALRRRIIGVLLKQARLNKDVSMAELAKNTHITEEQIGAYEFGQQDIPLVELEDLATALAVGLDYFLEKDDNLLHSEEVQSYRTHSITEDELSADALPKDMAEFYNNSANIPYLRLAMRLSNLPVDTLRQIAEEILEITY